MKNKKRKYTPTRATQRKGGLAVVRKYGRDHMAKLARLSNKVQGKGGGTV